MKINKKIALLLSFVFILGSSFLYVNRVFAATPVLSVVAQSDGDTVQVTVAGDPNSSVLLYYTKTNVGPQIVSLGTINSSGTFSTMVSSSQYGIASGTSVSVSTGGINGSQSTSVVWPTVSSTGTFTVSQTSLVLGIGQTTTITAYNNSSNTIYLSNNSNPPIANVNISGNQISITGISNGSTVVSLCAGSSTTCTSVYVSVQNGSVQPLTFSVSNATVAPGQSLPITISGGTGTYSVLNNSNSAAIQTNISGSIITLTTNASTGSSAITVCSSDMTSCGIINATASSVSSSPLGFSQINPTISVGQILNEIISGGATATYYISSNSNSSAVAATINGNNLALTANNTGVSTITVCASSGSCGSTTVTASYVSSGGTFQLSQSNVSLLVGQVLSITVSGGTSPYSLSLNPGTIFQASVNGNIITISGIATGSSTINVCTAGSACTTLTVTVNASGSSAPITFSQNNINVSTGSVTPITLSGSGGYYVSTSSNPGVASVQINGNTAIVSAVAQGSSNISICQTGGECSILSVTVASATTSTNNPTFSQTAPTVAIGQTTTETLSGGTSSGYYVSSNTNPTIASLSINSNQLVISGLASGTSLAVICAASNSCSVLPITVSSTASTPISITTTNLLATVLGQVYSDQLTATGGSGSYTYSVTSGTLPAGLSLSSNGVLSGTTTALGTSTFNVSVTDSAGNIATTAFSMTINSAIPVLTPVVPTAPTTPSTYTNGELINENGTIYIVYQNTKVGFANAPAFLGLGFNFSNVTSVTNSGLAVSDKVVVTASGAHPRGTWVSSGQTVYFVTPNGLIPVADWATFLQNGGQASYIVPANSYDLAFPQLSIMTTSDGRLQAQ